MKKPPPSPSHQQEPPYQSPPRPPPPLRQQEPSHQQLQPPRTPPVLHQQEPSQQAPPRRAPVITYIQLQPPKIIHTSNNNFKSLVQRLTGKPGPDSTTPSSSSPAMEMYNAELEKTKPRLGFVGGDVETTYQNRDNQLPNVSPGPTSMPSVSPELFATTTNPQDLQSLHSLFPWPSLADVYWNQQRYHHPPTSFIPHGDGGPLKRPRFDLGHDMHSYVDRGIPHSVNDTRTIASDYDMYLRNFSSLQAPSLPSEEVGGFNGFGGGMGRPGGDNLYMGGELMTGHGGVFPTDFGPNDIGFGQQDLAGRPSQELLQLPPDASNTLFVEGLPSNCSMREIAHIFRPFPGYKEVRLVTQDSKQENGDPIVLCFVDFENPACAATARNALQGYRMDEEEPDSEILQIQFSRNPGPRPGQGGGRM